jgi:hypothetical protein
MTKHIYIALAAVLFFEILFVVTVRSSFAIDATQDQRACLSPSQFTEIHSILQSQNEKIDTQKHEINYWHREWKDLAACVRYAADHNEPAVVCLGDTGL